MNKAHVLAVWLNHVISSTDDRTQKIEGDITKFKARFEKALYGYDSNQPEAFELEITKGVREKALNYDKIGERLRKVSVAHEDEAAEEILFNEMTPVALSISQDLAKLIEYNEKGATQSYDESKEIYSASFDLAMILIVVSAVLLVFAIWFAITGIAKPIQNITASMKNLASGDANSIRRPSR
ncbi:MCP four helix bundle domain-containing protein [Metarhizobium album]|uniref:MCP four helix bundle domain-containing protein n=1 Tax=Metarhizobium album TaxID=2182425 RepID=UPI0026BE52D6